MSLGYGVVQLDVTIVNTALNAIGTSLGGGVVRAAMGRQLLHHRLRRLHSDRRRAGDRIGAKPDLHGGVCHLHGSVGSPARLLDAAILIAALGVALGSRGGGDPGAELACAAEPRLPG